MEIPLYPCHFCLSPLYRITPSHNISVSNWISNQLGNFFGHHLHHDVALAVHIQKNLPNLAGISLIILQLSLGLKIIPSKKDPNTDDVPKLWEFSSHV